MQCSDVWHLSTHWLRLEKFKPYKKIIKINRTTNMKCKHMIPFMIIKIFLGSREQRPPVFSSITGFIEVSVHWIIYWLICLEERHSKPDDQWHSSSARLAFIELFPPSAALSVPALENYSDGNFWIHWQVLVLIPEHRAITYTVCCLSLLLSRICRDRDCIKKTIPRCSCPPYAPTIRLKN